MEQVSLYFHVPFCRHRCSYCDFNTYAGLERFMPAYVDALCREIEAVSREAPEPLPVHTLFFGGGTPSLLSAAMYARIIAVIERNFRLDPQLEFTIEANPGTVGPDYLKDIHSLGVNRISYGMQSAHEDDLRLLERQHRMEEVAQAVAWSRQAGFDNLSLDLIFGIPYQDMARWQATLRQALQLAPEHLSLYALTLEHGTPMQHQVAAGQLPAPDDDLAADMYDYACEQLEAHGYRQYEISNWARGDDPRRELTCRHNLQYWRGLPYLGLGAGAHGFAAGVRTANVLGIPAYIQRCQASHSGPFPVGPATAQSIPVDRRAQMEEFMMVGLRLTAEGVAQEDFTARFQQAIDEVFPEEVADLLHKGLLEWVEDGKTRLRLTPRARLLGNLVFSSFVSEGE
ncbi:MAG: radical SAM family heme chaperone HemW [Chloroflexi bacterium]|jgi:oxygen-independent coproporphyrinogen-3 oxidase|nr:radical SAM family heme chaperone HemW [Anaerolineaceae bacterium]NMB87006.1 radical SAM family heme chaperone HemW [Chloroflexota bacterium]